LTDGIEYTEHREEEGAVSGGATGRSWRKRKSGRIC